MSDFIFLKRPYYVYILILIPLVLNTWWQWEAGNLFSLCFAGFCIGTVLNSWFFCNFQAKVFDKHNAYMNKLMKENLELKREKFNAGMSKFEKQENL